MVKVDLKTKIRIYLITAWALATAKNKDERQEIIKLLNDFEKKIGDE
jgi:hypothetical protein